MRFHHFTYFKDIIGVEKWNNLLDNPEGIYLMVACVLLTMTKLLDPRNFHNWVKNRIRTFSGVVGNKEWIDEWTDNLYPSLDRLVGIHSFLSANFQLRKTMFQIILSISRSSGTNVVSIVCKEVIQLMRGAEMHHMVLIDQYLFNKYPELLKTKILQDTDVVLGYARRKMESYNRNDLLYAKIINHKDDTAELNRNNVKIPALVATACARFENDTFDNYYIEESDAAQRIVDYTTEYLKYRFEMMAIQAGGAEVMGEVESKLFFEKVVQDFSLVFLGFCHTSEKIIEIN